MLKDEIALDEFLWRFIEQYHRQDLDALCGPRVKYEYRGSNVLPLLVLESTDGSTVRDASENITCLCQELAASVSETTFSCPPGVDRLALGEFGRDLAENVKSVFYVDGSGVCHVVGPKDGLAAIRREILAAACIDDHGGISGQAATGHGQAAATSRTSGYRLTTDGGLSVEIYTGNLLHDNVEVVVNPANVHLSHGGGAAKAIADAAGPRLQSECRDYIQRYGNLRYIDVTNVFYVFNVFFYF